MSSFVVVVCASFIALVAACTAPAAPDDLPTSQPKTPKNPPPEAPKAPEVKKGDGGTVGNQTCATVPPNNKCGLDPQCGCLVTETCDVTNRTNGSTSCVTGGTATLGRQCENTGDCMAGLACLYGACRPYCKTPLSKCSVGGTGLCVTMNDAQDKPIQNMSFCTLNCDPREPTGVCGTNSCHWFESLYAPEKVSDCNFAGATDVQQVCKGDSDCKPGLACIDHPKYGLECERWCRIGVAGDCGTDPKFTCKDVFLDKAPVINGVKEGICQDD